MTTPTPRTTTLQERYPAGTFAPRPQPADVPRIVVAQAVMETKLFLRHGEQQLLNVIIPLAVLIGLAHLHVLDADDSLRTTVPFVFAIAALSAGFTGQAISVAFDRRYGALKRIGASGVPPWAIIAGKICAVFSVTVLQVVLFGGVAVALGWRPSIAHILLAIPVLALGVALSTAMGLLLGGTLSAETVLALANLTWFVLVGIAGYSIMNPAMSWLEAIPSAALAHALHAALTGHNPIVPMGILALWALAAGWAANRWFRFND